MIQKQFFRVFQLFARWSNIILSEKHLKDFANHIQLVKMI